MGDTTVIMYYNGEQIELLKEVVQDLLYDPFPDKEKEQKEDETTKKSGSKN